MRAARIGVDLRPATDDDLPFLERLYASTRRNELAATGWPEPAKAAFLQQQFAAQHSHYSLHYPQAERLVALRNGSPIGRLYIHRSSSDHRIVDIALLPEETGKSIGTAILTDLTDEAAEAGRSVSIHVERMNPALSLYRRLGFEMIEDKGVYLLLEWRQVKIAS